MPDALAPAHIDTIHLRLRPDGMADSLPVTPAFWPDLIAGKYGDFHNEFLVSVHHFTEHWSTWERHPMGDEIVLLLSGAADLLLDLPEGEARVPLRAQGEYAFVPKGCWHTADVPETAKMLFITAGENTGVKPRD